MKGEYSKFSESDSYQNGKAIPMEYLKSLIVPGLSPHELQIKKGSIVILLRNIKNIEGFFNGTRSIIDDFIGKRLFRVTIEKGACLCREKRSNADNIPTSKGMKIPV